MTDDNPQGSGDAAQVADPGGIVYHPDGSVTAGATVARAEAAAAVGSGQAPNSSVGGPERTTPWP